MKKILWLSAIILTGSAFTIRAEDKTAPAAPSMNAPQQAAPAAAPAEKPPQIEKMAVGTAIDNRELSGEAKEFSSVERLYCWTKVTAAEVPTQIKHVWYADGKQEAEVTLDVKYPSTRTWSSKSVWPGKWKVDATSATGEVLASVEFTVSGAAAAPAPAEQAAPPAQPTTPSAQPPQNQKQ